MSAGIDLNRMQQMKQQQMMQAVIELKSFAADLVAKNFNLVLDGTVSPEELNVRAITQADLFVLEFSNFLKTNMEKKSDGKSPIEQP